MKIIQRLCTIAACCAAFATATVAQEMKVVGIANYGPHPALGAAIGGFKEELKKRGFEEGKNVRFVEADATFNPSVMPQMLTQIEAAKPDVILTVGTMVSQAAITSIKNKQMPLVFVIVNDPVQAQLVPNWESGSARFTGSASMMNYGIVLEFTKRMFPQAKTFGVLYAPGEINDVHTMEKLQVAAKKAGYTLKAVSVDAAADVQQRSQLLSTVDFVYAIGSSLVQSAMPAVASVTDRYNIPILSAETELIKQNVAAVSFAASYPLQGAHAGSLAAQLLQGKKPPELAPIVPGPGDYNTLINRKKLEQLKVPLPSEFANCNCFVD